VAMRPADSRRSGIVWFILGTLVLEKMAARVVSTRPFDCVGTSDLLRRYAIKVAWDIVVLTSFGNPQTLVHKASELK
jgi:hypothetical protein